MLRARAVDQGRGPYRVAGPRRTWLAVSGDVIGVVLLVLVGTLQ